MSKHTIIYVPGLGDSRLAGQTAAIALWRLRGVKPIMVAMRWNYDEPFNDKLARLLARIDLEKSAGNRVSLIGASAGASVVITAFAERPNAVSEVACICGKLRHPETVSPATYAANPAFRQSMEALPASLARLHAAQRARLLSARPIADQSVPPEDTVIDGAAVAYLPVRGHVQGIAYGLTLGSRRIVGFLKSRPGLADTP